MLCGTLFQQNSYQIGEHVGFSLLTLARAASTEEIIFDTTEGEGKPVCVKVRHNTKEGTQFFLVYEGGIRRLVLWSNDQGYPSPDIFETE